MVDLPLKLNDASSCLSPNQIFLTSNPVFLASAIEDLQTHPKLKHWMTLTLYYTKVPYTADTPAPPHLYLLLFTSKPTNFKYTTKDNVATHFLVGLKQIPQPSSICRAPSSLPMSIPLPQHPLPAPQKVHMSFNH